MCSNLSVHPNLSLSLSMSLSSELPEISLERV